jgi:hypothetical protein
MNDAAADGEVVVALDFMASDFMAPEMAHSLFFASVCSEVDGSGRICLQQCFHCRRPK